MSEVTLTLAQLGAILWIAVTLAVTDGAALSRIGITWTAKRAGVNPYEITQYDEATDGKEPDGGE